MDDFGENFVPQQGQEPIKRPNHGWIACKTGGNCALNIPERFITSSIARTSSEMIVGKGIHSKCLWQQSCPGKQRSLCVG